MSRPVIISGTDPGNPKTTEDVINRLGELSLMLESVSDELARMRHLAGSGVRTVLHYDQSWPDKRATLIAQDVAGMIEDLSADAEELRRRLRRSMKQIADCGVNLHGKYEWRPR